MSGHQVFSVVLLAVSLSSQQNKLAKVGYVNECGLGFYELNESNTRGRHAKHKLQRNGTFHRV